MELNIKEYKISGDGLDSNPLGFYELNKYSNNPLFKSDSGHKSSAFTSKEEQINSNNEIKSNEIENKNLFFSKKEENNNNNIKQKQKNHKDKIMQILSQEKSKISKKESYLQLKSKEILKEEKNERTDRYGTVINKKNKRKIKISFIDQINKKNKLVTEIKIESFKKYNIILGMPKEDYYMNNNNSSKCQCCILF